LLLEVHERMQLMSMLPVKGGYAELETMRKQREMLSFTADEVKELDLKQVQQPNGNQKWTWDVDQAPKVVRDVPVGEYMTNYFRKKLVDIEKDGELTEQNMSLYEKFVIMSFK